MSEYVTEPQPLTRSNIDLRGDLKSVVARLTKDFVRTTLAEAIRAKGFKVLHVDTADALKAYIVVETKKGERTFVVSVKEMTK